MHFACGHLLMLGMVQKIQGQQLTIRPLLDYARLVSRGQNPELLEDSGFCRSMLCLAPEPCVEVNVSSVREKMLQGRERVCFQLLKNKNSEWLVPCLQPEDLLQDHRSAELQPLPSEGRSEHRLSVEHRRSDEPQPQQAEADPDEECAGQDARIAQEMVNLATAPTDFPGYEAAFGAFSLFRGKHQYVPDDLGYECPLGHCAEIGDHVDVVQSASATPRTLTFLNHTQKVRLDFTPGANCIIHILVTEGKETKKTLAQLRKFSFGNKTMKVTWMYNYADLKRDLKDASMLAGLGQKDWVYSTHTEEKVPIGAILGVYYGNVLQQQFDLQRRVLQNL